MKKIIKYVLIFALLILVIIGAGLTRDKFYLQENVIRLHVVANSDSPSDQRLKLLVRDEVLNYLEKTMGDISTKAAAMEYLSAHLQQIEMVARMTVEKNDSYYPVHITLQQETFPTREYDSFSLPAGIYDALRINIGEAAGRNWWCVTFPNLCLPATGETFVDVAVDVGFSKPLIKTLQQENGYRLRFFLLERFGILENLLSR